jgi:hypothetical protein
LIFKFSLFPPKLWSSNDTTNACESFHLRFNSSFYHHHPNLHLFVKVLIDIQTETYIKIRSSHTIQRRQTKTISKYQFIFNQKDKYIRREIWHLEFISKVCHKNIRKWLWLSIVLLNFLLFFSKNFILNICDFDYCFINIFIIFFNQFLFYLLIYCKTDIFYSNTSGINFYRS